MNAALLEPLVTKQSTFEDWTKEGYAKFARFQETEEAHEQSQWAVGKWLVEGLDAFDEKAYKTAKEITGWELGSLRNIVWVVRRFLDASLRSDTVLKWSHFKELAPIKSDQKRLELLHKLDDGYDRTVEQVRVFVDKVLDRERKPAKHGAPKGFYLHTAPLKQEERKMFKAIAKKQKKSPDVLLRSIVLDFIAKHKDETKVARKR